MIRFKIIKWTGQDSKGNPCASNEEMTNILDTSEMFVAFVNSYFDGNDFENPVKYYIDDRIYDIIDTRYEKFTFAYIKENTLSLQDNIFNYSPDSIDSKFNGNI